MSSADGSNDNYCREAKRPRDGRTGLTALNDCLSSEFASYLEPSCLANLASVSRRLNAVAQDTARLFVDGASDAEKEGLKPLLGGNQFVLAYRELVLRRSSAHDALLAAPAIFAKPGDQFLCWGEGSWGGNHDPVTLEFVGRNDVSPDQIEGDGDNDVRLPQIGWLVFKQADNSWGNIDQCSGGLRDALSAWPYSQYSHYDASTGKKVIGTLCVPPSMCGQLHRNDRDNDDDDEEVRVQVTTRNLSEVAVTQKLLSEAKEAVPAIFASVGDQLEYGSECCVLYYIGRHTTPPELIKEKNPKLYKGRGLVDGPQLGWLMFKKTWGGEFSTNGGIRDRILAWPEDIYSPYDAEGKKIKCALCLPPEKCGVFRELSVDRFDY